MTQRLTYIEIDLLKCTRVYGVAPCTAAIGVTGERKCFNTRKTCQDLPNYSDEIKTIRFSVGAQYQPFEIESIQNIKSVSYTPSIISLGESIGARSKLVVTFGDHPTPDTGPGGDPYPESRPYIAYDQGTFWGKFKARQPYLKGRTLRWFNGQVGDTINTMEARTFIIDSVTGPNVNGQFTITAKDPLKLIDDKEAQAPALSKGLLSAAISIGATAITLSPPGVGNLEYPSSGFASIGGNEIVSYTRSGDVMTISRGKLNTAAQAHDEDDRVQVVIEYSGVDPADIIYDLMTNYGSLPASFIDLENWKNETSDYLGRVYTGYVAEPTAVVDLVNELLQQSAMSIWWDELARLIRLQVLRDISKESQNINDDLMLAGSFTQKDQPKKRVSQVWTYFGQINPLEDQEDAKNYRSTLATVNLESEENHGSPSIKTIFCRWIPQFGRTTAERLNNLLLGRYSEPPRLITFDLLRDSGLSMPTLGNGYSVESFINQNDIGELLPISAQATKIKVDDSKWSVTAEEIIISDTVEPIDPTIKTVAIDSDTFNFNLRSTFLTIYSEAVSGDTVVCEVRGRVVVGSNQNNLYAFTVGAGWPAGVTLQLNIQSGAFIVGAGGDGGQAIFQGGGLVVGAAANGGAAIKVDSAIEITNDGVIGGGGGGGGNASDIFGASPYEAAGGGGAGAKVGQPYTSSVPFTKFFANPGTLQNGGDGGSSSETGQLGGNGGDLGQDGQDGQGVLNGPGGVAGSAVNGDSLVTWTALGDVRGNRIN